MRRVLDDLAAVHLWLTLTLAGARLQVPETVLTTRDLLVRPRQMPGMIRWWRCG
jgi:hypothetical protein